MSAFSGHRALHDVLVTGYGRLDPKEPVLRRAPRLNKPVDEQEIAPVLARLLLDKGKAV